MENIELMFDLFNSVRQFSVSKPHFIWITWNCPHCKREYFGKSNYTDFGIIRRCEECDKVYEIQNTKPLEVNNDT